MVGLLEQMEGSSKQTEELLCLYRKQLGEVTKEAKHLDNLVKVTQEQANAIKIQAEESS